MLRRLGLACRYRPLLGHPTLAIVCTGNHRAISSSNLRKSAGVIPKPLTGNGISIHEFTATHEAATQSLSASPLAGRKDEAEAEEVVLVRGRVERCRGRGKLCFIHLRQPPLTSVQVVCSGKELASQAQRLTPESVVEVTGVMRRTDTPVSSTTCSHYELHATEIKVLSAADTPLPFPLRDDNTKLDTRLNHRPVDLRTPLSTAIMRIVSQVCQSFRTRLLAMDFVEIHTPKLVPTASEGGSAVFRVDYFAEQSAYLAQSPQLYKQMTLMGDAMRVFEIGPVFRAENSLTHRHLTEFVGLDVEMVVRDSYLEVLDVLEYVMCGIFSDLQDAGSPVAPMVRVVRQALASEQTAATTSPEALVLEVPDSVKERYILGNDTAGSVSTRDPYLARVGGGGVDSPSVLRLHFDGAVQLLRDCGDIAKSEASVEDFSLQQERLLGERVRERYGVDVYVVDQFPTATRPFYTMPLSGESEGEEGGGEANTQGELRTRSYDMYLRGEEICSGAQRVHSAAQLQRAVLAKGADVSQLQDYLDAFRYGAWPHGGFGLGLERIVLFFLGAKDIRQVSLYPRDPKRIAP